MPDQLNKYLARILNKTKVELELDLAEMFPNKKLDLATKEQIAQAIIDKIISNSESGLDRNGKKLPKYSKGYSASEEFKLYGKNKDDPNMTLSGDMLGQIDILKITGNKVRIGWEDELQNAKAHGNITGQEGKWTHEGKKIKRDFFGLKPDEITELKKIIEEDG
jgi:hypothetical protein